MKYLNYKAASRIAIAVALSGASCFGATGGALPWEKPLTLLLTSMSGPVAFAISIIGLVAAAGTLMWAHHRGEISDFAKIGVMMSLIIGVLAFAIPLMSSLFGVAAATV